MPTRGVSEGGEFTSSVIVFSCAKRLVVFNHNAPNAGVERAARTHATYDEVRNMTSTLSPLRSNDLFGGGMIEAL